MPSDRRSEGRPVQRVLRRVVIGRARLAPAENHRRTFGLSHAISADDQNRKCKATECLPTYPQKDRPDDCRGNEEAMKRLGVSRVWEGALTTWTDP